MDRCLIQSYRDHDGGRHGSNETFQKVGAVAGDIVYIIADEVCDHVRYTAVILRQIVAELCQNIGRAIGGFRVVSACHTVKHSYQRAAQRIGRYTHHSGVALQVSQKTGADGIMGNAVAFTRVFMLY